MSNEAQNGNFAKPMLAVVVIGKKSFKNADEFLAHLEKLGI